MLKAASVVILLKLEGFSRKLGSQELPFFPLFISVKLVSHKWKWHIIFEECTQEQRGQYIHLSASVYLVYDCVHLQVGIINFPFF